MLGREGGGIEGEAEDELDVAAVPALVARVAPALGLQAGLGRAVRVGRTRGLGEALAVRVDGTGRAGVDQHREVAANPALQMQEPRTEAPVDTVVLLVGQVVHTKAMLSVA